MIKSKITTITPPPPFFFSPPPLPFTPTFLKALSGDVDTVKLSKYVPSLPDDTPICFFIGAMAHGVDNFADDQIDEKISISEYPLSASVACGKLACGKNESAKRGREERWGEGYICRREFGEMNTETTVPPCSIRGSLERTLMILKFILSLCIILTRKLVSLFQFSLYHFQSFPP